MPCGDRAAQAATAAGVTPGTPAYTAIANYKCGHWSVLVIVFVVGFVFGRATK